MSLYKRALRTFDTSTLTANFQNVGAVIPFAVEVIVIVNTSTVAVLITDGSSQEDIEVAAQSTINVSVGLNNNPNIPTRFIFDKGTQLQVKQVTAAAAGSLIINCFGS